MPPLTSSPPVPAGQPLNPLQPVNRLRGVRGGLTWQVHKSDPLQDALQQLLRKSAAKYGFRFPLLADTDKAVGAAYGILGPLGFYRRSVFVIDAAGMIHYAHRSLTGASFRPATELIEAVHEL